MATKLSVTELDRFVKGVITDLTKSGLVAMHNPTVHREVVLNTESGHVQVRLDDYGHVMAAQGHDRVRDWAKSVVNAACNRVKAKWQKPPRTVDTGKSIFTVADAKEVVANVFRHVDNLQDDELVRFIKAAQRANRSILRNPRT